MRIGAFELRMPLPDLRQPHVFACLEPWINVGSVGTLTLSLLEEQSGATHLGQLVRPGNFFDFTRYRPISRYIEGRREITLPNSLISYSQRGIGNDLLFFHLLEPHAFGELYVKSVLELLCKFSVKRYCLLGAMMDAVPHTRLPPVTGGASEGRLQEELIRLGVRSSGYQGPTSITSLVSQQALAQGIETMSLIVHLPHYARVEKSYAGQLRLLDLLRSLYGFPLPLDGVRRKARQQQAEIDRAVEQEPEVKAMLKELEKQVPSSEAQDTEGLPRLSPEIERFLNEIDKRFDRG